MIEATAGLVAAYKPNMAFYEVAGAEGLEALRRTIDCAHAYGVPVILDAKRGDVGHSSGALARAAFEVWGADAVTVSPYLGADSIQPFTAYADKGVYVLCHTSNPGAVDLQEGLVGGLPLYLRVADLAQRWNGMGNVGLVVGATFPEALAAVRAAAPEMPFLVPGVGAQGGDLEAAVAAGVNAQGRGLLVNASRAVACARKSSSVRTWPTGTAGSMARAASRSADVTMAGSPALRTMRTIAENDRWPYGS